jgi:hypothetical protein
VFGTRPAYRASIAADGVVPNGPLVSTYLTSTYDHFRNNDSFFSFHIPYI